MILYVYMLKIRTITATKCLIENSSDEELEMIRRELTYTDTGVQFNLSALKKNRWLRQNKPHTYEVRLKELESQLTTCMLKFDQDTGKYSFSPGFLPYLANKCDFTVVSGVKYPEPRKMAWRKVLPFDLYKYQQESVERLIEAKHGSVELCTGAGKTSVILTLAREIGGNFAIVTPSKSIFLEILEKFEHHFGKNNVGAYGNGKKVLGKKFTVCISKSLTTIKEDSDAYEFFSNITAFASDESHLNAASTLEKVFHGVLGKVPYRFFLSGTQVRGDGKDKLLKSIIGGKVHELSTKDAIEGGFICPVKFVVFETTSNDSKNYKDPLKSKRKHFLYNNNIATITAKLANSAWNQAQESTLILVEELCQIQMLAAMLTVPFGYAHSASKAKAAEFGLTVTKPHESVEAFNKGEIKVLIGTSCISTGTNMYSNHNTVNWVGGSSEVKTKQGAIGRSVRLLEKSEYKNYHKKKPYCRICDFKISNVDLMEKHLQKRLNMYKETTENITVIKI